jgi:hypothetical protein
MSLCATNARKVDAALLDDGVAYTLASGSTSARHQPSCYPPGSAATTTSSRSRRVWSTTRIATCPSTCVTDQAGLARCGKIACHGSCQSRTRVNAAVPGNYQTPMHPDAQPVGRHAGEMPPCSRIADAKVSATPSSYRSEAAHAAPPYCVQAKCAYEASPHPPTFNGAADHNRLRRHVERTRSRSARAKEGRSTTIIPRGDYNAQLL